MSSTLAINSDQLKSLCSVPGTFYPAKSPGEDLTDAQESFIRLFRAVIAEPYSESQVSIEAQSFVNEALPPYVVVLILAGITVLAWLPLWISRCCAHRCCPPSEAGPSRRWRRGCTVCYGIMYFLLFICAVMGMLACVDLIRSLERATCDSVTQLGTLGETLYLVATNVSAYSSQRSVDANTQLDQGLDGLACARDALVNLCARVEEQHSAALALDARLDNATDAWDSALGLSAQAATACNGTLAALPSTLDAYSGLLPQLGDAVRQYWSAVDSVAQQCLDFAVKINDINTDILSFSDDFLPTLRVILIIAAICYFVGPMMLNTVSACFVVAWVKRRETPARCNAWAVQCVGFAWVFASLTAFIYLITGLVVLFLAEGGYELGGTVYISSTEFSNVFNHTSVCGGAIPSKVEFPIDLSDPGQRCYVFGSALQTCYAGNNYIEELFKLTGLNVSLTAARDELVDLTRRFDDSELPLSELAGVSEVNATLVRLRQLVSETAISQLGGNQSHVDALAALAAAAVASASAAAEASDCVTAVRQAIIATSRAVRSILFLLIFVLTLILQLGECQFIAALWTGIARSLYSVASAPLILGITGLVLAGVFSILYIPPAISMQVMYGGVGLEPGCPRRCRCCCAATKRKSSSAKPAAISSAAISATRVTEHSTFGESPSQSRTAGFNTKVAAAARTVLRRPTRLQTEPNDREMTVPISPRGVRQSDQPSNNIIVV